MSDKIYACLLRLYPSRFREKYEGEALQLYRDRFRNETGFLRRTRLWCDLLADLIAGLPQAYQNYYAAAAAPSLAAESDGIPSFRVLDQQPLRPGSILVGSVLSLVGLAAFTLASRPNAHGMHLGSSGAMSPIESVLQRLNQPALPDSGPPQDAGPATAATTGTQAQTSTATAATASLLSLEKPLDAGARDRVIQAVSQNLNEHYVDREGARRASDALPMREKRGDYDAVTDGQAFAQRLTTDVWSVTQDRHLAVVYSRNPIPNGPPGPPAAASDQYRAAMRRSHCTFERVEVLPGNIGYLKLNSFPDPAVCRATATAAMARLNRTDAIIFDLRDNGGGYPDMVELIAAPLFDHPVPWYNPRDPSAPQSLSSSPVAGSRLANKPAYILTSSRTFSGAEHFTYNLKMLKRATIIGETTGGGAHVGVFHRIDDHFGMGIPETRIVNPYGKPDWEGTGVEPDVKVRAADALEVAKKLAKGEGHKK